MIISIDGVEKYYGKQHVLSDVHLGIEKGSIFGLIGPSGAGKTTLIKLMVGMEEACAGTVRLNDHFMPNRHQLNNIGYMAQSDALYNELSGRENLEFFASLYHLNKDEQRKRIEYAAGVVDLLDELNKRVKDYSGGMKRRLSLALALIQNPDILILDEPTVGIDPELRQEIWKELFSLKELGKTIIVTTHVMDEAERCDALAFIREGVVIAKGSPSELKTHYEVDSLENAFLRAGGKY